ncbi:hypothetical protein PGB90_010067 [Kerria lacca]
MGVFQQRPWTPTKRRGPIAAEFTSPGPACVSLGAHIGKFICHHIGTRSPAFSFGSRRVNGGENVGPGPGQYNVTGLSAKGKDTPPAISLYSRNKETKSEITPAPGDYNPEKATNVLLDNSPKYTFGLKTQVEKPSTTPAPNVYHIPTALCGTLEGNMKAAPAYSISGRQKEFADDRIRTPGPGTYDNANTDAVKPKPPAYTVSARYQFPSDSGHKPGPGAYSPEKVIATLPIPPSYSFGIKHSPFIKITSE